MIRRVQSALSWLPVFAWLLILAALAWYLLLTACGCAGQQQVAAIAARVETVEARVTAIGALVHTRIGGDGDSIASWLAIGGLAAAALFYPLIWRPIVRKTGLRRKPDGITPARP